MTEDTSHVSRAVGSASKRAAREDISLRANQQPPRARPVFYRLAERSHSSTITTNMKPMMVTNSRAARRRIRSVIS